MPQHQHQYTVDFLAPPAAMTPQEAFDYSAQMVDLWDEQASMAEGDLWEAQVDAIRAAYQAD